ncbi:Calx-beta domain-containing protein [Kordia sp.]|uniref:Calx-beta domain-containing protein n=1 Tax=Kordia sp. TaxID=1965332 RepID=UPI003D6BE8AB
MKKILSIVLCVVAFSFFSCENDDNATTLPNEDPQVNINFEENFGTSINARFLGRVVNEQNEPIQGATIRVGNTITTTDIFGIFSVSNANAYEKFAYITAEKDGYINGSRAMAPSATEVNRVEIMLLKEDVIATINTEQEATVNLPNGTEVTFDGNFINTDGSSYSGDVKVILKHLSPDDENMDAMMPGMLFAQDASGDAVALETYGMLAVELRSGADQELQLAEGSTSQISMPLAANTTNPPATIPLWHFDETEGYWIEEGEATLQGNMYVGDVSHFSFWNYDYPYPSIYLCIELQDEDGNPMPYAPLDLYSSLLNSTGTYGYTNGNGVECGLVPSGEELTVIVPGVSCVNDPFTTIIGPFTSDTTVVVTVNSQNQNTSTITGTFVTCDGDNVTDGYMQLYINGTSEIIPVSDGTISYTVSYCGTLDYSIKGIDVANNQVTAITTGTLNGDATVDLGTLSSCTGFVDSDGDGIFDSFEDLNGDNDLTNDDTDDDGIPNYLDEDDDGDGINTADEDYDGDNDPTNDDTDGDQIPNYLDAQDVVVYSTEVAGTSCDPLVFDLDNIITEYFSGSGTANMTYVFYENEADATSGSNPITTPTYEVPLASVLTSPEMIFIKGTSTITGQSAIAMLYLYYDYLDTDQDGLTDCEETTGVDIPGTPLVPNGTSDPNDPNDPNVQPDTTLIVDSFSVSESAGTIMIPVSLSQTSSQNTVINIVSSNGSAVSPDDYLPVNETITILAGQLTAGYPVEISIVDDTDPEANEVIVIISTVTSGAVTNPTIESFINIEGNDGGTSYPTSGTIEVCSNPNGVGEFDLNSMDAYFMEGEVPGTTTVTYHLTQVDADANMNALVSPFIVDAVSTITLFVRIVSPTGEIQISTLVCVVYPTPLAVSGLSLTGCDGNGDGITLFNLQDLDAQILQTQADQDFVITYHQTQADADNNTNPIPSTYENSINPETIYYRIESLNSDCFATGSIDLIVDPDC